MYGEALLARGRVREALQQSLEAYRYEPASRSVNYHVALAALYSANAELTLKHAGVFEEVNGRPSAFIQPQIAGGYLIQGKTEDALAAYAQMGERITSWFPDCVRARGAPDVPPELPGAMRETLDRYMSGELDEGQKLWSGWQMIRCSTWIGEPDIALDLLLQEGLPTELSFLMFFIADAGVLRQHPRFRLHVEESGLLEYWREWGWSDYCRPDGDSFICD
jgi:hypothetical protein